MFSDQDKKKLQSLKTSLLQYYNKKMNELGDPKVTSLFYDNCIITGGCIASLFHYEAPNDIDLYSKDIKSIKIISDLLTQIGTSIVKEVKSYDTDDILTNPLGTRKLITNNAITLTNNVQFITIGAADECRKNFDFIHCMPWYDLKTQKLYISESQFDSIKEKKLVPNMEYMRGRKLKETRISKYVTRGWKTTWEHSPTTSIESLTSIPMTWGIDSKASGMGFPGVVAQEMTALYPNTTVLK